MATTEKKNISVYIKTVFTLGILLLLQPAHAISQTNEEKAERLSKEAFTLLTETGHENPLNRCFNDVSGDNQLPSNQESDSFVSIANRCQNAIQILEEHDDMELISLIYNDLYLLFYHDGDYDSATLAAEKSLDIAKEINYTEMQGRGNQNFGILNSVQGRYPEAVEFFLESEKHYSELEDESALAMLYGNIGVTFEQAGNYAKAFEYTYKELNMARKVGNTSLEATALSTLGAIHSQGGSADSVLYYYEASLELAEHVDYKDLIITNHDNIGAYYTGINDYSNARNYLYSAYELASGSEYQYQKIYITNNLAKNYLAEGLPDSALKYAEMQLDLATDYNFLYDQQLAWSNLSDIYKENEDYQNALEARVNYSEIKDSLLDRDRIQQLENLREQYESEQREQTIDMLTLEAETATFRRNTYLASGILISLILLLLYSGQRYKARKNRQLLEKSKEVAQMKSNFFSNISHEFRTPLTLISGPIESLKSSMEDPDVLKELNIMQKNSDRLLSLINQLLDLSRLESGNLTLSVAKTKLDTLVKGVAMSFQSLAEMKRIQITVDTEKIDSEAWVDRNKLETILINLIGNALKFTPEDGEVHVRLSERKSTDDLKRCRIEVSDSGEGIPEGDLEHIFDRFYRGPEKEQSGSVGSGIGLALTKELVLLHKGQILVNSSQGKGTRFTVELPISRQHYSEQEWNLSTPGDSAGKPAITESRPVSGPELELGNSIDDSAPLLLLIEDNEDVMNYLSGILKDSYHILFAPDGEAGVEIALEQIPDLVISDVMMPKMDGYRVAEILKQDEKTSHIPLILLTAKASHDDRIQGLRTHADDYVTKPFRPDELLLRVENLILSRNKMREKFNRKFEIKPEELSEKSMEEAFLLRVVEAIKKHLVDEEFSVDILAHEVGMSRSQLHRKLVALTDLSATEFIRSYRLNLAKDKIKYHTGSISEIAYEVGFNSSSYFSRSFKEKFGVSPSEFKADNGEATK